jgi:hypothetical protein
MRETHRTYAPDLQGRDRLALLPLHPRSFIRKENAHLFHIILLVVVAAAVFILAATVTYSAQEKTLVERRELSKENDAIVGATSLRAILRLVKIPGREFRFDW